MIEPTRRRHLARWVAAAALLTAGALVAGLAAAQPSTITEVATPLLGHRAPAVSGTTLADRHFDLSSLRGRWVVVNFFASWCPPCRQEQPGLVTFAYQHRRSDVALVGVVFDDTASRARSFLAQSGATWPVVTDPGGQIALDFGVSGPPETFLISPRGVVTAHLDGPVTSVGLDDWLAVVRRGGT